MSLVAFYNGAAPDNRGRYLRDILKWPDERLESVHDYIQWLFPLAEPSAFNPSAPTLDAETIAAFHHSDELRENLRASFHRMRDFYRNDPQWLTPGNHNHLRLTRILKSLRLLGLPEESTEFYQELAAIYREHPEAITQRTFQFWSQTQTA
jgi:hypothetical protein